MLLCYSYRIGFEKDWKRSPNPGAESSTASFFKAWPVKNLLALMEGFALRFATVFERVVEGKRLETRGKAKEARSKRGSQSLRQGLKIK